ncbi:MAG: orotidine-5'-phosphate decarboxylase [Candidatus Omnitrophica bacterium]|nr:orotidine-5'-phosphate decarboxylase [Candidatus Omnitrophota bacterium]
MTKSRDPLILALDLPTLRQAAEWVDRLYPEIQQFKIGSQLFTAEGPKVVEMVHKKGGRVFLDLKWHDIPNTVANACREAVKMGVWMCNVHAFGGADMLKAAQEAVEDESRRQKERVPSLIAVTVLTSMDPPALREVGIVKEIQQTVRDLAKLAQKSGLDGVVCSGHELQDVRSACGDKFITVVPGIQNPFEPVAQKDQKRTLTPRQAIANGADYIVMGRSILNASDPVQLVRRIRDDH